MEPETIAAICLSGITAIASIFTIGIVSYKTSFGDKQNTGITLTSEIYYPGGAGLAVRKSLIFNADDYDQYEAQFIKFKNGKQEIATNNINKPINVDAVANGKVQDSAVSETTYLGDSPAVSPRIIVKRTIENKDGTEPKHEIIEISDLQAILDNDLKGEQVASKMRQSSFFEAISAYTQGLTKATELVEYYIYYNLYNMSLAGNAANGVDSLEVI